MDPREIAELRKLTSFPALVAYLSDRLDWPIQVDDARDIVFDYDPEELDLDPRYAVKIEAIKQVRPLVDTQPWGIFYVQFESKRLPVVVLRRVVQALVPTSRRRHPERPAWAMEDLLFICSQGEPDDRSISFAHFRQTPGKLPELDTFSWDCQESHFYYIKNLNLEALRWPADEGDMAAWQARWSAAFPTAHRAPITTAQELASRMAQLAAATRAMVNETHQVEREGGPLHRLYDSFRRVLIHDLSVDDFADMYAQTVTYGLFSARATHSGEFSAATVTALVPNTNPFLRDLLEECLKVGVSAGRRHTVHLDELGVDELVETLRDTDIEAILREFGRQSREHKEDPVIHFYESFLREYDAEKKARRGVFYTPDPVVSFIVRSVDHLLRTEFGCPDGLADTGTMEWQGQTVPRVQILDPATGTGTFLQHVIQQVYATFCERDRLSLAGRPARWNEYVARHLLPRLYGFELMMAPYAVAHMKLGLALRETGYDFSCSERLRIYLTNTLQPAHEIPRTETPFLAAESQEANHARMEMPITVVIGNPPYSGHSANKGQWIVDLVADYKRDCPDLLKPAQAKWLQDDYVKFIRFGQWRIEQTGVGILAMITNHAYLDNPTFRGMRRQLLQSFTSIFVLDLHGNLKKKEAAPDGSKDGNVFDIEQGVAICIMVKRRESAELTRVYHADLYGTRGAKYQMLMASDLRQIAWQEVLPQAPSFLFVQQDLALLSEYEQGWKLSDIMSQNGDPAPGVVTTHDDFAISWTPQEAGDKVRQLLETRTEAEAREIFTLCSQSQWNYERAKRELRSGTWKREIGPILYRPFDFRWTVFDRNVAVHRRERVTRHMRARRNIGLIFMRQVALHDSYSHFLVSRMAVDARALYSNRGIMSLAPLYLYPVEESGSQPTMFPNIPDASAAGRQTNLSPQFVADLTARLNLRYILNSVGDLRLTFGPEDVFNYMYAVFHSPTYRMRYAEFLKRDFPRLPLTRNPDLFRALCGKGAAVVALHLLESPILEQPITRYVGAGDHSVSAGYPRYEKKTVWINAAQGFQGVPEEVWAFQVGGYQVCHKWLKDRRGRVLSGEDRAHYAKVVVALHETIRLMAEIDAAIEAHGGWPIG